MQPESSNLITATDLAATAETIAAEQLPNGMILWFDGGHADPWNHTEAAMALSVAGLTKQAEAGYQWLADAQDSEGWWHHYYVADGIKDHKIDTNVCAYIAAGVWHHWLITQDRGFLETMWPVVQRAIDFVLTMQKPTGEIIWARHADGTPWTYALLTGSSSIYHSLRCAIRIAETVGHERPVWEFAAVQLGHAITDTPEAFEPKDRWAMDWYYPVLAGAVTGEKAVDRLAKGRDTFVMPDLGVRCVSDQPWVTAAETCECAMAYLNVGNTVEAVRLFESILDFRDDEGAYYTGTVYPGLINFPDEERSTYTSAAVILAADAIDGKGAAAGLFVGEGLPDLTS